MQECEASVLFRHAALKKDGCAAKYHLRRVQMQDYILHTQSTEEIQTISMVAKHVANSLAFLASGTHATREVTKVHSREQSASTDVVGKGRVGGAAP